VEDPRVSGLWNRDFFGGDLKGIQDKLGELQSLGIDTLWLTPIFKARSNHRYDTDNYLEVDPALGGDAALTSLVAAMHSRGMYLILDGVFNHTSSDSLYFDRYHRYASDGACESLGPPFRSWYEFLTSNVPCGSSDYNGWAGFDSLPTLDHGNPAVRSFIFGDPTDSVVKHWFDRGANGWRLDVADQMPHDWWRDFRTHSKSYSPDAPLIGEIWPDASQFLLGDQLDSVMNYRFRWNIAGFVRKHDWQDDNQFIPATKPSEFDDALRAVREDYPPQATAAMLNLLDSHDTNRALFVYTERGDHGLVEAKDRLKLAALFQFTYIGAPTVYYGDEAAINAPSLSTGASGPEHDPYNRAPYPWPDASGDPTVYGPIDTAMVAYYTRLAHLRSAHPALRTGAFQTLLTGDTSQSPNDNDVYAFARTSDAERPIAVALNKGSTSETAMIPVGGIDANGTVLQDALTGARYTVRGGTVVLTLAPRGGALLVPRGDND
jgi:glycosidase